MLTAPRSTWAASAALAGLLLAAVPTVTASAAPATARGAAVTADANHSCRYYEGTQGAARKPV
ncbi:hypothetical protein [Streptomyces halobius]|uniref:Uncharacterized protein n=1 Tax=Streptomyces halobius TaxID=2879846 RepID=A0ABY4M1Q5_9ACTN|nr:hypothetical protein [Streptomyces halobius]UQA90809.1 hypothetical protein K9S39_01955 [Streptomyces halobius]